MPENGEDGQTGKVFRKQDGWDVVTNGDWRAKKGVKDNCKIFGWIVLSFAQMRNALGGKITNSVWSMLSS